jgi:hypothetical protein
MILAILYTALKLISPESFKETLSPAQLQSSAPAYRMVIDTATLSALSGEQIASLFNYEKQGAALLVVNASITETLKNETRNKTLMEEVLSPHGQSSPTVVEIFRGKQSAQRASSEALGLAG